MIPVGQVCEECSKIHVIKSMEEYQKLSPRMKTQAYKSEHRIFDVGYYCSLDMNDQIWEFYLPLSVFKIERVQEEEPEDIEQEQREMEEIIDSDEEED